MKHKIFGNIVCIAGFLFLVCICFTKSVDAFLITQDETCNKLRVASHATKIQEQFENNMELILNEKTDCQKVVQVKNEKEIPCYIRMLLRANNSDIENTVRYDFAEDSGWLYIEEQTDPILGGYYYYEKPLQAEEVTAPLINGISVTEETRKLCKESAQIFEIIVYEESIPVENAKNFQEAWEAFL